VLHGHRDLKVYQLAYELAMDIFQLSKQFPREEFYFFNGSDSSIFAKRRGEHRRRVSEKAVSKHAHQQIG